MSRPPRPALERFMAMVDPEPNTGCWLWLGATDQDGYASFNERRGLSQRAQRYSYRTFVGPIADGLVTDHLCHTPSCVNPSHLEAVTQRENLLRRELPVPTHCAHGHPFDEANTRWYGRTTSERKYRRCRTCHRESERRRREAA